MRDRWMAEPMSGCWLWLLALDRHGYGVLHVGGRRGRLVRAHRWVWESLRGPLSSAFSDLCHHCDNRACVNPDHLFEGSRADNMADAARKGRPKRAARARPGTKLTMAQAMEIRASARPQMEDARRFGVSQGTITAIRTGKAWKS